MENDFKKKILEGIPNQAAIDDENRQMDRRIMKLSEVGKKGMELPRW